MSFFSVVDAQTELDSLYTVWEDKFQPDSSRIDAYYNYIRKGFLFSNPDSSQVLSHQLIKFSNEKNHKEGVALSYKLLGIASWLHGDLSESSDYNMKSLQINKEIGNDPTLKNSIDILTKKITGN